MADLPFYWPIDLELSRIRTLYGSGDDPVLPYEPPSTVIKVSKFHLGNVAGTAWQLQFEHTKIYDQSFYGQQENTVLLLQRDNYLGAVDIEGTVGLYDISNHKCLSKKDFDSNLVDGDRSISISLNLTMNELSHVVFQNLKLCIQGNVTIVPSESTADDVEVNLEESTASSEIHIVKNNPLTQLSHDFASLLNGEFSDVTIKCDASELLAHKNILAARSPVFAAMFKSSMIEGKGKELIVPDVKLNVLQEMLMFMYSSQVKKLDIEMACDLLHASDKYHLPGLLEICANYLKSNLSADNALHILTVADLYSSDLKGCVLNYIGNYFYKFEDTSEWKSLKEKNMSLVIEVLECTVKLGPKRKQ